MLVMSFMAFPSALAEVSQHFVPTSPKIYAFAQGLAQITSLHNDVTDMLGLRCKDRTLPNCLHHDQDKVAG